MDVGVQIKQYKIVEHIGRGGMADVWSARDQELNRMVAVKTIAHGLSADQNPVEMFRREAQTIANLEHPHILPIYAFGDYEGQLYIVMRYVAGGSLEDLLRRGPLPLNEALRMAQAIAEALDYAHMNKVVHLDLKPPNVLLDSHNSPYLADFGLAKVLDREGKTNNPGSGTLLYMAPEQLTSELIDHRADVYSFCLVLFHMLTGQLPFEATIPLALKQLQYRENLPDPDLLNPGLPTYLGEILRRGTSVDPSDRPPNVGMIIDEIQEALAGTAYLSTAEFQSVFSGEDSYTADIQELAGDITDMEILEAVDIYSRARHAWAGGNGRFLLGVTHFMLMNSYYMDAERHGLEVDEAGRQMLLRGALEYDVEVNFWWSQLDDDNRRWVCLHAIRSNNVPARVRALYRLETLPDAEKPQIPKLVAQLLQVETKEEVRLAALQVLGTRAKLMKPAREYDIKTEYRGRMLTTMTRLGVQVNSASEWREAIFSPEIDLLLAEIALDDAMPRVAEFAARIIGRIHSVTAVRHIANRQKEGGTRWDALRALALVRDEAPSLPDVVSTQGRLYAWMTNTIRRMFDRPMLLVGRAVFALIGAWLAMGQYIWTSFRSEAIFSAQRIGSTMAVGLIFALFTTFVVIVSGEFSKRLRGFWPDWVRLLLSGVLGFWLGTITWGQFIWFYLNYRPSTETIQYGGFGLALGFVVTAFFGLRSYISIPLTAIATYLPILLTWRSYWFTQPVTTLNWNFFVFSALLAAGGYLIVMSVTQLRRAPIVLAASGLIYLAIAAALWRVLQGSEILYLVLPDPLPNETLFYYDDNPNRAYTLGIPFALMLAIGGHFPSLIADLNALARRLRLIGRPTAPKAPAPLPAVPRPAVRLPQVGAVSYETVALVDAPNLQTEMDAAPIGARPLPDLSTELDVTTGDVGDDSTGTEVDVNQGVGRSMATEMDPGASLKQYDVDQAAARRVNIATGIKVVKPTPDSLATELDVNAGLRSDNDEDKE
jgi:hypothetical protein